MDFDCACGGFFLGTGTGLLRRGGLGEESGVECAEFRTFRDSFLASGVGRFRSSSVDVESAKEHIIVLVRHGQLKTIVVINI